LQEQLGARTRELAEAERRADHVERQHSEARREAIEAVKQKTATSEVLQVISSSPSELNPVFEIILANATRLCRAKFGTLTSTTAVYNVPEAFAETRHKPFCHHPRSAHAEMRRGRLIHPC